MSVAAARAPRARVAPRAAADTDLLFTLPVARALGFVMLSAWGALHWMAMLQPSAPARGWAAVAVGLLAAVVLLATRRLTGRRRTLTAAGALVPLALLAAAAAG